MRDVIWRGREIEKGGGGEGGDSRGIEKEFVGGCAFYFVGIHVHVGAFIASQTFWLCSTFTCMLIDPTPRHTCVHCVCVHLQ